MDHAVAELTRDGIVVRVSKGSVEPSGRLFVVGTANKTNVVFDLKSFNATQPYHPPPAQLPTIDHIRSCLATSASSPWYFTKLDLRRCYDSIILPPNAPKFYFKYRGEMYQYLRMPFGWSDAPYIVQNTISSVVELAMHSLAMSTRTYVFVYLDDVLVAAKNAADAEAARNIICNCLRRQGFRINMEKSSLTPSTSIHFIGYNITTTFIHPILRSIVMPTRGTSITSSSAKSLAGAFLWRSQLTLPFLLRLFRHPGGPLPADIVSDLTSATHIVARAHTYVPGYWRPVSIRTHTQPSTYFCDANAKHRRAACITSAGAIHQWIIPTPYYHSQQLAELYAVVRAIHLIFRQPNPRARVVSDSASALFSVIRMSPGADFRRARLLRSVSRLRVTVPKHYVDFGYVTTVQNPADPMTHVPAAPRRAADLLHAHPTVLRPPQCGHKPDWWERVIMSR